MDIKGHWYDRFRKLGEIIDTPSGDACCLFFGHGLDHYPRIVKCEDTIGLGAVSQKASRDGMSDDERDNRMPGQTRSDLGIDGRGSSEMNAEHFFASPIRLAC